MAEADAADDLESRPGGVEGRDVRGAVEEPPGVVAPDQSGLEGEGSLVGHPAGQPRAEPTGRSGIDPEERRSGPPQSHFRQPPM